MPYPPVPMYTEISHFRAPYKDSLMGLGALLGKIPVATKASAPSKASASRSPRVEAAASIVASKRPIASNVVEKPQKASSSDIENHATYLAGLLWVDVSYALLGSDPRTWGYQTQPTFSKRVGTANALIADPNSGWRKAVRAYLLKLAKTFVADDVKAVAMRTLKMLEKSTSGFAFVPKVTGTSLDPKVSAVGAAKYVADNRFAAIAAFNDSAPQKIVVGISKSMPGMPGVYDLETTRLLARAQSTPDLYESADQAANDTPVCQHWDPVAKKLMLKTPEPVCTVFSKQKTEPFLYKTGPQWKIETFSSWPLSQRLAFEDGFAADVAQVMSEHASASKAKKIELLSGASGAAKGASGRGALVAASDAEKRAKSQADEAAKKASDSLAKAQAEIQSLKDELVALAMKPPVEAPLPEPPSLPPPVVQSEGDALVERLDEGGRLEILGVRVTTAQLLGIGLVAAGGYYFYSKSKKA